MDIVTRTWTEDEHARIQAWLLRVCSHPLFVHSARQQSLLAFIVNETLAGRSHLLKGYTLGVEVFGRSSDFDPIADSIVRVEVTRLRSKLVEYYASDGREDEVMFELPKGGYAPIIQLGRKPSENAILDARPTLAVLPFANVSDDSAQSYFADGLSDDLITDLSKLSGLLVISRQSSFVYRNSGKRAEDIAAELGVRYLLVGSVRKAAGQVRISAQLVDAQTGGDIWAERYDRDAADIFAVQDDVANCIVEALQLRLTAFERERLGRGGTQSVEAHDALLRGLSEYWHFTPEGCAAAQACFRQSLELDPAYAPAHAWLARSYIFEYSLGWNVHEAQTLEPALVHAKRAVELDDFLPLAHAMLCWVELWLRNVDIAIKEGRRACALDPNDADAHLFLSFTLSAAGCGEEALHHIDQGMRLNPHPSAVYLLALGQAHISLEDYESAFAAFRKGIEINPLFVANHTYLAAYYAFLGREDEAAAAAEAARKLFPGALPKPIFIKLALYDHYIQGYKKADLEHD
jgi:adenylate cyclase